jgi:hypothetical protein
MRKNTRTNPVSFTVTNKDFVASCKPVTPQDENCDPSGGNNGSCVAVAIKNEGVAVKNTQGGPIVFFSNEEWRNFTADMKAGRFNV